ncbi:MAG: patatin-like phospholipase family protein [Firmicutes bacterium]|nr:patatin-like phospholipase family protein [Bacillota bacterium]
MATKAYAVFEGGGVKAFGIAGALFEAERLGYTWENVAGTSAGAMIAALIAAGYTALEIKELIYSLDMKKFKDGNWLERIPHIGPPLNLWLNGGLYLGAHLEKWMEELLAAKGVKTFGDLVLQDQAGDPLFRYRLVIIATDVTKRKLLKLPQDISFYNISPDRLKVSAAVRMSASLPFFYEPYRLKYYGQNGRQITSYIVDGGVLSNFPVWIFDSGSPPLLPTIGFKIVEPEDLNSNGRYTALDLLKSIVFTMLEAHDKQFELDPKSRVRTISIPSLGVKTTDFDQVHEWRERLFQAGVEAAARFFGSWNFEAYKILYCKGC